jgi:NAD(P)-dependent dehydrogenase (short-subunit alcohol dehydrogenase family)
MKADKTVLITGASTGFGRDTAETLARAGHQVFASMRSIDGKNREHAEALRNLAASENITITPIELDVTSDASVEGAVDAVLRAAGRIDVLINNAGIASAGVSETFTAAQARDLFEVNVIGVHRVTRAVLPVLRRQHDGLIVNVGSVLGRVTLPFFGIYCASKYALEALTESYRYELSQLGVEIALVQPSAYPTQMYSNVQQPTDAGRAAEYGKVGEIPGAMFQHFTSIFQGPAAPNPHDVAQAIARLIDMAKGKRATRTIVGAPFGSDVVNAQTAPVQAEVVRALGLGHLDTSAA